MSLYLAIGNVVEKLYKSLLCHFGLALAKHRHYAQLFTHQAWDIRLAPYDLSDAS